MSDWRELAKKKRTERDALFPKEWLVPKAQLPDSSIKNILPIIPKFLSTEENTITTTLGHQIVQKVVSKEWSAEAVAKAFCHRATITHQLTNCLTEVFFDAAIARAKQLDEHLERTGRPIGVLHGLPISLKDQFNIEGVPCSMGYVATINRIPKRNSVLAQALLDAGAILYVRTNVPQALMLGSTVNNVFGETVHPANRTLTPGGSSGGEAALILAGGSPLGVGTDLGGSLRDPSSWCGLYALRPSNGRVPYEGAENSMFGQESIRSAAGPMTRSIEDVELFFKAVVGQETWKDDPQVIPIPWREVPILPKYHFGIILDDGVAAYHPPVKRAMQLVADKLRAQGHEVIEVDAYQLRRQHDMVLKFYFADGGKQTQRVLDKSGEPWLPQLQPLMYRPELEVSVMEYWDMNAERDAYRKEFSDWWNETNARFEGGLMDGLLCTGLPMSALPLTAPDGYHWESTGFVVPYIDYVGGVVPVLQADPAIDIKDKTYKPRSELDRELWEMYDPEAFKGGWAGVQIVGRRLEEEKVLNLMRKVDEALLWEG
jgi:amidase